MTLFSRDRSMTIVRTFGFCVLCLSVASAAVHLSAFMLIFEPEYSRRWVLPLVQLLAFLFVLLRPGRFATSVYVLLTLGVWVFVPHRFGSAILDVGKVIELNFFARTFTADVLRAAAVSFQTVALPWVVMAARRGADRDSADSGAVPE